MTTYTAETIAKLEAKGFNRWTKGNMDRLYIDAKNYGVRFEYYKTGNIRNCFFTTADGETVNTSNAEGYRFKATKAYIDLATEELHIQTSTDYEDEIRENIEAIIAECMPEPEAEAEEEQIEDATETTEDTETSEKEAYRMAALEDGVRPVVLLMAGQMRGDRAEAFCRESGVNYPGIWDSPQFATVEGIIGYINLVFDFAPYLDESGTRYEDYDLEAVAMEITEWEGGRYVLKQTGEPTWDTIRRFYSPSDEGETEDAVTFVTMNEAVDYVEAMLGEYADSFDVESIAREMTDWVGGKLTLVVEPGGMDELLAKYDRDLENE